MAVACTWASAAPPPRPVTPFSGNQTLWGGNGGQGGNGTNTASNGGTGGNSFGGGLATYQATVSLTNDTVGSNTAQGGQGGQGGSNGGAAVGNGGGPAGAAMAVAWISTKGRSP